MSEHRATLHWERGSAAFTYETYPRDHVWRFAGGVEVPASSAPAYLGNADRVDPEAALVAALSSCHMLTFLAIAARKRMTVDSYADDAVGFLEKNEEGRLAVTRVVLRPKVVFGDGKTPAKEELERLHHAAHENCFIANSVKTLVTVESSRSPRDRVQGSEDAFALDLDHAEAILPRYEGPGPRYTSYPTAPVWTSAYAAGDFASDLASLTNRETLSLYAHVPFCASLCHFCACNRIITRDVGLPERYLDTIAREIDAVRALVASPAPAAQLHWGGGTPTHLSPAQIRRLFHALTDAFPLCSGAEVSIEVDPRVTGREQVETLRALGFDRISLGVQDVEPRVQEAIHRIQPAAMTASLVDDARRVGFSSVNFDLIYGLPFQREDSFTRTLDTVLAIGPDRIALYSYAHVTWVAKQQRGFERKDLPDASTKLRILLLAIRRLLRAGYVYVGMDHFARPDDELACALRARTLRRNFMGYTTQADTVLLGFGPSAISELPASYAQNERELGAWEEAVRLRGVATLRGHRLHADDEERRFVITRIMCHGEISAGEWSARFGRSFSEAYARELASLDALEADGLLLREGDGSLRVTPLGRLLVRNLAMAFDAYLPEQQRAGARLFSRAV